MLTTQLAASGIAIVYTLVVTFVILKVLDLVMGPRVDEQSELEGMGTASHGESGYND